MTVRRGDVVLAVIARAYGKVRPALVLQDQREVLSSVVCCMISSDRQPGPFRIPVSQRDDNGLDADSAIAVDKLCAVPLREIRRTIGRISGDEQDRVAHALADLFGLSSR